MNNGSDNMLSQAILILLLILINAFFAASEMAVISANKNKISSLANEGDKRAKSLIKLVEEPNRFLATIQVGITLAGFLASASAAVSISKYLSKLLNKINVPFITNASDSISLIVVTMILSYLTLVLGELLPKRLALQNSERVALFAANPIMFISKITLPFVKILTFSTNILIRLFHADINKIEERVTEEEIRMMINVGEESGVLNETEKEMIDGIFEFDNTLAKKVMTPRTNVFSIDINTPIDEMVDEILEEQYSRIPIFDDTRDNILGILYMKDLFTEILRMDKRDIIIKNLLRPAYFVPETKNIDILFRELQKSKNHMAILVDEYGSFSGIVTIEDLIEEVMGNIFDEHDEDFEYNELIQKLDNNTFIVNGLVSIDEINEKLNLKLPEEYFDTIGGFVIDLIGNIPEEGKESVVEYEEVTFKVEKIIGRRIELLKIYIQ
ncbi:MAG: putative signal transduction protein with domain containing protein [Clostridiales bacterium]|jgi:putative hemolysin|nr:putative signal transduction protein with domain containing protein [Clostridiales bacterium]